MRKIVVFNMISLDGYYARENGDIDWHQTDEEFNKFAIEQTQEFGAIIFGKTTYKLFEEYWPQALEDPKTSQDDRKIAQIIDDVWKIVFSTTLKQSSWKNTHLVHEINPKEINQWKEIDGKDLVIFGSGTIVQQFANLGLTDEYRLMVNPVVLGKGKPMFSGVKDTKLQLTNTRKFKNGNILLYYSPIKTN